MYSYDCVIQISRTLSSCETETYPIQQQPYLSTPAPTIFTILLSKLPIYNCKNHGLTLSFGKHHKLWGRGLMDLNEGRWLANIWQSPWRRLHASSVIHKMLLDRKPGGLQSMGSQEIGHGWAHKYSGIICPRQPQFLIYRSLIPLAPHQVPICKRLQSMERHVPLVLTNG